MLVDDHLERPSRATRLRLKARSNIIFECECGSHILMLAIRHHDVHIYLRWAKGTHPSKDEWSTASRRCAAAHGAGAAKVSESERTATYKGTLGPTPTPRPRPLLELGWDEAINRTMSVPLRQPTNAPSFDPFHPCKRNGSSSDEPSAPTDHQVSYPRPRGTLSGSLHPNIR